MSTVAWTYVDKTLNQLACSDITLLFLAGGTDYVSEDYFDSAFQRDNDGLPADTGAAMGVSSALYCIQDAFSCNPSMLNFSRVHEALSKASAVVPATCMSAVPVPIEFSDAVARRLLPPRAADISTYSTSERMFIGMATRLNWPQEQSHQVLEVLRDPSFQVDDLDASVLRKVRFMS